MDRDPQELIELGSAITELKQSIRFCQECYNIADNQLCSVCTDTRRDATKLMVVEKVTDLSSIERTGLYRGLYHVLGGAINAVDGIVPENLRIHELTSRLDGLLKNQGGVEVILATNPSTPGETTLLYLRELLQNKKGLTLTRLARGLASGSHLEYVDETTLRHALDQRK